MENKALLILYCFFFFIYLHKSVQNISSLIERKLPHEFHEKSNKVHHIQSISERRQVIVVGREKAVPSFNQLDGQEDAPTSTGVEENIIDVLPDDPALCETHKVPPAKVRHPDYGIGTFVQIDSTSANFVYEFPNCSYLVEV